jgi:hypothetical protein
VKETSYCYLELSELWPLIRRACRNRFPIADVKCAGPDQTLDRRYPDKKFHFTYTNCRDSPGFRNLSQLS